MTHARSQRILPGSRLPFARALVAAIAAAGSALAADVDLARHPALSPDGATVVFSWRGDLWKAAATGGAATRLTSAPGHETRSAFTPDGARIVFESDRDGLRNLWSMAVDGSDLRAVTSIDAPFALASVGTFGGETVAFLDTTIEGDLYRSSRPYLVPVAGGTPRRLHDAFGGAANASPDGAAVLFERGGSGWSRRGYHGPDNRNVWSFDPATGAFAQLTEYDGNDGLPRFLGAGEFVYISDRGTGSQNLHRAKIGAKPDTGRRLTDFDGADIHGLAVAGDGKSAVMAVLGDLWRLDLADEAAKPVKLAFTAADDGLVDTATVQAGKAVSEVALSPDGKTMAFVADGDVFVRATEDKAQTRRVTEGEARERDLCWSADGLTLYFASDAEPVATAEGASHFTAAGLAGNDSIFAAAVAETRKEARERGRAALAAKKDEVKAEEPKAEDGKAEDGKTGDGKTGDAKTETPAPSEPPVAEPAAAAPQNEPTAEPTSEPKDEPKKDAKKEEKKDEKKDPRLDPARWADALRFEVRAVTGGADDERRPIASPDGRALLFMRNLGDLVRLDLATNEETTIHDGWDDDLEAVFSPDGRLLAIAVHDLDFNKDIWVMPADGSAPAVNVTRHPDNDGNPRFSADGKVLAFLSERTNEELDAWVVMLDRDLDGYSARDLDEYFKAGAEAAKKRKPLEPAVKDVAKKDEAKTDDAAPDASALAELELDDAYLRVRRVTSMPGNESGLELVPAGDRIVFIGGEGKDAGLHSIKWDGSEQKRLGGAMRLAGLTLAGDRVIGLSGNSAQSVSLSGDSKSYDISAENKVEIARRNRQKLLEVSRLMGRQFYKDPAEKGLDWAALTAQHAALAERARTADEFDFVANAFIGHLDGSHLGVRSRGDGAPNGPRRPLGRIGVAAVADAAGLRVTSVLPQSPAALANPPLAVGDLVTAIDFTPVDPSKPLEAHLEGKTGDEVFVSFRRTKEDGATDELMSMMVPVSSGAERALRYQAETLANAAKVAELSGGRLGYIHIQGMNQESLDRFERDLYAAVAGKQGLLIDVRNNGGGWTADRLLASIDAREHAYTIPREGAPEKGHYPQDRLFIQRYTLPKAMLCNEKSFSNAEITSHAFKTLGIGPLVGQQTAGGVISTGSASLVDGTTVRMPFRGWYLANDGRDMEENGAMPDFVVVQTPEDESKGRDAQLEKAVEELLKRLR
ncbi:MAG: hypothetical protein RI967_188 [Planctomycetota bacterium]